MSHDHVSAVGRRRRFPFYARVLAGVALGTVAGLALGGDPIVGGLGTQTLGELGLLVIRALKTLATPLIFCAVLDAVARTEIPRRKGVALLAISSVNALVAVALGLGVAHALEAGKGRFSELGMAPPKAVHVRADVPSTLTLDPLSSLSGFVPENLIDPFRNNSVVSVVLLALLAGLALRAVMRHGSEGEQAGARVIASIVHAVMALEVRVLGWIIEALPLAVACVLAAVVGRTGGSVFLGLGAFLGTIVLGLCLHAIVYYSVVQRLVGRLSPRRFWRHGADAVTTALSSSSSLATVPVTLRCLERLGISPSSARLAACVGTNLNHDGIILYEASATIFVAQALGMQLSLGDQLAVAGAAVMAGIGIAGVPEAGLITLPLVLAAGGIPQAAAALVIPLVMPVDWIIGRLRAATNVLSDMTVAVLLDRFFPERPR